MRENDTIAAVSTAPGEGGIAIVRLSGPGALKIADRLFVPAGKGGKIKIPSEARGRRMLYGFVRDPESGASVDEVLLSVMRAPATYTCQDMVEINCHGGYLPVRKTLELALREGARLAAPGEFTKRAFLNGRIDLSQAEAVLDLIRATSEEAERVALEQLRGGLSERIKSEQDALAGICAHIEAHIDFPEEDIETKTAGELLGGVKAIQGRLAGLSETYAEGKLLREGLKTAIVGRPNVGKSSLLNALLGEERAIVTELPGTTRDVVSEYVSMGGYALKIMDTAGIRKSQSLHAAEKEGMKRSLAAMDEADLVICVLDGSTSLEEGDFEILDRLAGKRHVKAVNKADLLPAAWRPGDYGLTGSVSISALTGHGLDALKEQIKDRLTGGKKSSPEARPGVIVTSLRHKGLLDAAAASLGRAEEALAGGMPLEIVSIELREALHALGEIVGTVGTEEILQRVFDEFCIGK